MAKRKKKNSTLIWRIALPALLLIVAAVIYLLYKDYELKKAKFSKYKAFGIYIPLNYEIHGIDVSKHQSTIYWPAVKEMNVKDIKIGFAFIKATEGLINVDRKFRVNWNNAAKYNMVRGAYHFFLPTKSGKIQANNFTGTVTLQRGDLPPVLDIEQLYGVSPAKMRKEIKDWLNIVEGYYGVKPIIYTNVSFYNNYLGPEFDEYPLWVAHYLEKDKPRIKRKWIFWQHSEEGRVNGIANPVDFNVFNGDSSDFKDLLVK